MSAANDRRNKTKGNGFCRAAVLVLVLLFVLLFTSSASAALKNTHRIVVRFENDLQIKYIPGGLNGIVYGDGDTQSKILGQSYDEVTPKS